MRILIATGGSEHSELALRFGSYLATRATVSPTIVTVIKDEKDRAKANDILDRAREVLGPEIVDVTAKVRVGHPAEEIIREAEEGDHEVVLVGEKQHHGLVTRFVLGSTALRVVEHAPCPVIITKGIVRPLHRILLCDSGAPESNLLRAFVDQFGRLVREEDEVTVLHVMSQLVGGPGADSQSLEATAESLIEQKSPEGEILERACEKLKEVELDAQPLIRHGLVVEEILAESEEGDYDLVVIGAHAGGGWRNILLDDLAHELVVRLVRPVIVVR